ncbi:MAG TPA: sigma-70 family RNA polymerase sigma factor [Blastocatellia bacterium]|nr:sigma-70 family RNA polymerase sigma factor [Blastocatellia bacterium]
MTDESQYDDHLVALIKRAAGGEQGALGELYDATSSQIYGLLVRMLSDRAAADEVLLDVYKQAWRQAALYERERGSPLGWLLTIGRTRALDRLRSVKREQQLKQAVGADPGSHSSPANPEQKAVISERQELVRTALGSLPSSQREVIELAYYSGLSHSEIAEKLDLPLGTVKTRTRLAMVKLRDLLRAVMQERCELLK